MKLGISGKLSSGKTTIASQFDAKVVAIGNSIKKTAGYLIEDTDKLEVYLNGVLGEFSKEIHSNLVKEFNNNFLDGEWIHDSESGFYVKNQSYRDLLQAVGDVVRAPLGSDIWCRMTLQESLNLINEGHSVICDDIRLKEEKNLFEEAGFPVIRLNVSQHKQRERAAQKYGFVSENQFNHKTEIDLDSVHFDFALDTTTDTVDQTTTKVRDFLKDIQS
ncbi:hypothetical protein QTG56_22480 (plasmid) [Rossellomorea sp. AcN35-11]|nr:hypothetical protein [Rossellomorea aquimaris]WJV32140.1 hypothetical protein QTG56_22480 [Rossellomorea sp. AcN35-11]